MATDNLDTISGRILNEYHCSLLISVNEREKGSRDMVTRWAGNPQEANAPASFRKECDERRRAPISNSIHQDQPVDEKQTPRKQAKQGHHPHLAKRNRLFLTYAS